MLRLLIAAVVKLATLAAFVGLVLHGFAAWAWPLLILFLVTRLPAAVEAPRAPATPPPAAAATSPKSEAA